MREKVIAGLMFIAGVGAGFVLGARATKNRYEAEMVRRVNEEIEKLEKSDNDIPKEYYEEKKEEPVEEVVEETKLPHENPPLKEVAKQLLKEAGYSAEEEEVPEEEKPILEKIARNVERDLETSYVISPAEFGEMDYEEIELTYYADGVLTEGKYIVDDPDDIVGPEALDSFGEYEEDTVYVRNDARRCDYAILRDLRKYSDLPRKEVR